MHAILHYACARCEQRPGRPLRADRPSLTLHREWADQIDPITREVIRHNLRDISEELGMTIQRIPGSPVATSAFDLSSSIFAEGGEPIYYGSYQLYMSGVSDVHLRASCTPYLLTLDLRAQVPGTKSRGLRRKGLVRQLVHQVQLLRSPPASVA